MKTSVSFIKNKAFHITNNIVHSLIEQGQRREKACETLNT